MKASIRKFSLIIAAILTFAALGMFCLTFNYAKADNAVPELKIVNGASVRIVDTGDDAASKNGLRFATYMSKTDYEALKANTSVTDVTFGVLIAPNTSDYNLTADTVFGESKKYDWAIYNEETNEWTYPDNSTYTRIMNFSSSTLYENAMFSADNLYFTGSIVGIKEENLAYEWQGIGYMSYTIDGTTCYQFTEKVARSIVYTAQNAIDDTSSKAPTEEQKTWLQTNYVNKVKKTQTTYSIEHYLEQKDGTFAVAENETVIENANIDSSVTPSAAKEISGYVYDEDNTNNVVASAKVLANGKTVFKRYYLMTEIGLVDKTNDTDKNAVRTLSGYTATVNQVIGSATKELSDVTFTDGVLDVSGLDGTYNLVLTKGEKTLTRTFDVYDSTQAPEWLNTLSMDNVFGFRTATGTNKDTANRNRAIASTSVTTLDEQFHRGNYYLIDGSINANNNGSGINLGTPWAFNVIAKHSKAYYQQDKYKDFSLTFDFKLCVNDAYDFTASGALTAMYPAFGSTQEPGQRYVGWYNVTISVATLLDNWDAINDLSTISGLGNAMFQRNFEPTYKVYLGNFKFEKNYSSTSEETPVWNNTVNTFDSARYYVNNGTWNDKTFKQINSGTDITGVGYDLARRVLSIDLSETDSLGGRTSGNYYMVTPYNNGQAASFALKPVYEKSVYDDYLATNASAVLQFDFYYTLPVTAKNDVRVVWTAATNNKVNIVSGSWYTVQLPLKYFVDNYDNIVSDNAYTGGGRILGLTTADSGYNSTNQNGTAEKDTTNQQVVMYFGNFQILASGTAGFTKVQ